VTAVPPRPLLAPWYRLVGDGDRLLLEHGQSVVALEGAAVTSLLPHLLPLLDGTRAPDDLAARLGAPVRPAIDHALETLAAHDLLLDGPDAPLTERRSAHAVAAVFDLEPAIRGSPAGRGRRSGRVVSGRRGDRATAPAERCTRCPTARPARLLGRLARDRRAGRR
jgi:hypothetical protein